MKFFPQLLLMVHFARAELLNFLLDFGGIPDDSSPEICQHNTDLLTSVLQYNASNNTLLFPLNYTFHLHSGVYAKHVNNTILQIDGTLRFERDDDHYDPAVHHPPPCFMIDRSNNVTLTSSQDRRGWIDGRGSQYWGVPMVGYLQTKEHRPRLVQFNLTSNLLIENLILQDSPYHTLYLEAVSRATVRYVSIVARRTKNPGHSWIDLTAFNTDGLDVSGQDIHVHDVDIWTQDDCIAVKDNYFQYESSDMVFERINASGLGLVVGSIGGTAVSNITFRDSYLHTSVKGIYAKFRSPEQFWSKRNLTASMDHITFENIIIQEPLQWPIWIGPAQQADETNPCHPNPCSLCWPMNPMAHCHVAKNATFSNITVRNVQINKPKMSPGVILANDETPMKGVFFDHVLVTKTNSPFVDKDLTKTFPGLKQPVDDRYVPAFEKNEVLRHAVLEYLRLEEVEDRQDEMLSRGMAWTGIVGAIVLFYAGWFRKMNQRKDLSGKTKPSRYLFFWILGQAFLMYYMFLMWGEYIGKPRWERVNHYFRCEGVIDGVATGNTWPVPDCFEDKTGW